jgi:hypothetical protein
MPGFAACSRLAMVILALGWRSAPCFGAGAGESVGEDDAFKDATEFTLGYR